MGRWVAPIVLLAVLALPATARAEGLRLYDLQSPNYYTVALEQGGTSFTDTIPVRTYWPDPDNFYIRGDGRWGQYVSQFQYGVTSQARSMSATATPTDRNIIDTYSREWALVATIQMYYSALPDPDNNGLIARTGPIWSGSGTFRFGLGPTDARTHLQTNDLCRLDSYLTDTRWGSEDTTWLPTDVMPPARFQEYIGQYMAYGSRSATGGFSYTYAVHQRWNGGRGGDVWVGGEVVGTETPIPAMDVVEYFKTSGWSDFPCDNNGSWWPSPPYDFDVGMMYDSKLMAATTTDPDDIAAIRDALPSTLPSDAPPPTGNQPPNPYGWVWPDILAPISAVPSSVANWFWPITQMATWTTGTP